MNSQDIDEGMQSLIKLDADIAEAYAHIGAPPPREAENSLETLLSIIVSQQISRQAANSIMANLKSVVPKISAENLLSVAEPSLREAGLSARKVEYAKGLATAVSKGHLRIDKLEHSSDEEVIETITSLRGFGRWSAEIYLILSLNRKDVFPANDLALLSALGRLKKTDGTLKEKQARTMIEHWSPYRSIGALFLWHYYRQG